MGFTTQTPVTTFEQEHCRGILVSLPGREVVIPGNKTTSDCWVSKPKAVCLSPEVPGAQPGDWLLEEREHAEEWSL